MRGIPHGIPPPAALQAQSGRQEKERDRRQQLSKAQRGAQGGLPQRGEGDHRPGADLKVSSGFFCTHSMPTAYPKIDPQGRPGPKGSQTTKDARKTKRKASRRHYRPRVAAQKRKEIDDSRRPPIGR